MAQGSKTSGEIASVGRPRASGKGASGDSRRDILMAAGKVFRAKGFAGASLREIGEEAGLRKASLYYYFKSKDDILVTMIEDVMAPPLHLIQRFESLPGTPAAKLWAYLYVDTRQLCLAPYDYSWMLTVAETRAPQFQFFWDQRDVLLTWIEETIRQGIAQGEFADTDAGMAARTVLSLDEFAVSWMPGSGRSPDDVAAYVADFGLRALLSAPENLPGRRDAGLGLVKNAS